MRREKKTDNYIISDHKKHFKCDKNIANYELYRIIFLNSMSAIK